MKKSLLIVLLLIVSAFSTNGFPPTTMYELECLFDFVYLENPNIPGMFLRDEDLGYDVGVVIYFYHTENGPEEEDPGEMTLLLGPLYGESYPYPPWWHEFLSAEDEPYWCAHIATLVTIPPDWQWETSNRWNDYTSSYHYIEGTPERKLLMAPFKFYLSD